MIEHVFRRASEATTVEAVLVATDDPEIAAVVDGFGGTAVLTRETHPSGTDRLAEVAEHLSADLLVNVQGDLPFLPAEPIDAAVRLLEREAGLSMATLRRELVGADEFANPSIVKVVVALDGQALYFTRAPIPHVRHGHPAPRLWKHFGLYVYRRAFLLELATLAQTPLERAEGLEQLRVLEHGYRIGTVETTVDTIEVDTPADLARARQLIEAPIPH